MSKLIEVYTIEVGKAVNDEMKMVWAGRDGYPSTKTIEKVLAVHGCKYANVKKLYKLQEETR